MRANGAIGLRAGIEHPVNVTAQENGARVEVGVPETLFTARRGSRFDVSPDGERFLFNTFVQDVPTPPITIVLNWAGHKQ